MKFLLGLLFFFSPVICLAQPGKLEIDKWVKKLKDADDRQNKWHGELVPMLLKTDSAATFAFLQQLERHPDAKGNYFTARFNCLKADILYLKNLATYEMQANRQHLKKEITDLFAQAMNAAYNCNDDYLTAYVSGSYGSRMYTFGNTEPAVMYLMNAVELYEKLNLLPVHGTYLALGEMMWRIREYESCIKYTQKALEVFSSIDTIIEIKEGYNMFYSNTIALAYHRMGRYDSAFLYYNKALAAQAKAKRPDWEGIISGNIAQMYYAQGKYQAALPLFQLDYTLSKKIEELYDNAANSLQWAARTNLALGKKDSALLQVREALGLLQKKPQANYLQNTYFTAAEVFKALKNEDSSYYYSALYNRVHDSIERVIYQSGINIARLRLAEEKNKYSILSLQQEKQEQLKQRNIIIISILVLSTFGLLLISRRNQKLKFREQLNEQEKRRIQQEVEAAKEQLQMFTKSLVKKTELIEQMEHQMQNNNASASQQETISTLSSLTILTEADWDKFKQLFEKIYPLFFQQLKAKAPDITLAEQRMAALTRLQLTTRQMASMQGVSTDSVHKTRQRLRQRLGVSNEINLEEYLSGI